MKGKGERGAETLAPSPPAPLGRSRLLPPRPDVSTAPSGPGARQEAGRGGPPKLGNGPLTPASLSDRPPPLGEEVGLRGQRRA